MEIKFHQNLSKNHRKEFKSNEFLQIFAEILPYWLKGQDGVPLAWGVASRKSRGAPSRHRLAAAVFSRRPIATRSRCSAVRSGLYGDGCSLLT